MAILPSAKFKAEALRMARDSGLSMKQIASNLGVGYSKLTKWKTEADDAALREGPLDDKDKEIACLRCELRLVTEEREILKNATPVFANQK